MRRLTLVAVVMSLVLVAAPASADRAVFPDPDEGGHCELSGPCPDHDYMDIQAVIQAHGEDPDRVRHGIRTIRRWSSSELDGYTGVTFGIDFDTDRDGRSDRLMKIRRKDGQLRARLYKGKYFQNAVTDDIRVGRGSRRSLYVVFDADILGEGIEEYRWQVSWWGRNYACPGSCGEDWAPHRGWYAHLL